MSKTLVAYFSATGTTANLSAKLAAAVGADLYEIRPAVPYAVGDLDWEDPESRSSMEMNDPASRPALAEEPGSMEKYDRIFVGFPIWWGIAPKIVNTFLEHCDLTGKTVIPFATSGESGMGETNTFLAPSCPGADLREGRRFAANTKIDELIAWAG